MTTEKTTICFQASAKDFEKIPGLPIAYWVTPRFTNFFNQSRRLNLISPVKKGIDTGENDLFLREWFEVCNAQLSGFSYNNKWFFYIKGGEYRKWYGNINLVVNWDNDGKEIRTHKSSTIRNQSFFFHQAITWSLTGTKGFAARYVPHNCLFDNNGSSVFPDKDNVLFLISYLNTVIAHSALQILNPTIAFQVGDIANIPIAQRINNDNIGKRCIIISKSDWDNNETSWDFRVNSLLDLVSSPRLADAYAKLRQQWVEATTEMHRLEEENNRIFIDAYGLQDELTPEVPWNEITLTCNPWYRYGVTPPNPTCEEFPVDDALEARLKADTIKEFLSYAVGCMFGRYSLDKPGLVLANQGETLADYLKQIPKPTFMPDENNVIPILDEDWFADDIATRFNEFLKVTLGDMTFYENLAFIEEALGKDVRSYFTKDFYKDHLQRYHNRPIYWLFSSPKGAFNALVYMHRYRPETVGLVLTYLRSHITKVTERIHTLETTIDSTQSTAGMKSKAIRERGKLQKSLRELEDYERDVLYPLATEKIAIDLDDGVKVNYRKFGDALYKIKGLEAKEE